MYDCFAEKRVIVTGASGFIGSCIVAALEKENAEVFALIRKTSDCYRLSYQGCHSKRVIGDLDDLAGTCSWVKEIKPHYVFHAATSRQVSSPTELAHTNVTATANLLQSTVSKYIQGFVMLGSSLEYGNLDIPFRESDLVRPSSFFGASKAAGTMMLQGMAKSMGFPVSILRLFHVYGPYEPAKRLVPTVIRAILSGTVINLTQPGLNHDYIFIEDVVNACLAAASKTSWSGEIFNVSNGIMISNEKIVGEISTIIGKKANTKTGAYQQRSWDKAEWCGDNTKAFRLLGWQPKVNLTEGLSRHIEWIKKYERI